MVKFTKLKKWYTLETGLCLIIQDLSTPTSLKSLNPRNLHLSKVKCLTVYPFIHMLLFPALSAKPITYYIRSKIDENNK